MRLTNLFSLPIVLSFFGCTHTAAPARLTTHTADAEGSPGSELDRAAAYQSAEYFAFQHHLLPLPIEASATREDNGDWLIHFLPGGYRRPDGTEARFLINWSVLVRVTAGGECSQVGAATSRMSEESAFVGPPSHPATEREAAVILARSFAQRRGLVPTATTVDGARWKDGAWVFAFRPGTYFARASGEAAVPSRHLPFSVYVDAKGNCVLLD